MKARVRAGLVAGVLAAAVPAAWTIGAAPTQGPGTQVSRRLDVPVDYYKLPNGLKVVLSRDATTPTAVVAVYYNIGFRNEPKDRTGFAHLFEHMMFQGSRNLGKMEFIKLVESNGGLLNGSTRFDFTNYFQVVPSHVLETILWAEADRMRGLDIDRENLKNQQEVVKNEVKVNVLNQPYGGFPWIDLPMAANENWYNAHNFYGDLASPRRGDARGREGVLQDVLRAEQRRARRVAATSTPAQTKAWIAKYFGDIPPAALPPPPDLQRAAPGEGEARRPHRPAREPAGARHRLPRARPQHPAVVRLRPAQPAARAGTRLAALRRARAQAGADRRRGRGHQLGPRQHVRLQRPDALDVAVLPRCRRAVRQVSWPPSTRAVERLRTAPVDQASLDRALVKMRSSLYASLEQFAGFGRANLLASFALFDDDPARINRLEAEFAKVTPQLLQETAREYLRPGNRTVYTIAPGKAEAPRKEQGR